MKLATLQERTADVSLAAENHIHEPNCNSNCLVFHVMFSPAVIPIRTLFLSLFGSRFLGSSQHSRWGEAPNARCCGGQGLPVITVGASDRPEQQEPVVHPRYTRKALAAPKSYGKPLRRRTLQLSTSGKKSGSSSPSALARTLGGSSSSPAIQLLPQSWWYRRNRGTEGRPAADAERGQHPHSRKGRTGSSGL